MHYETFKFIIANKNRLLYDNAATGGNDTTNDPGADKVNPNNYLAPVIGGANIVTLLCVVALIVGIIYMVKNFKTWQP